MNTSAPVWAVLAIVAAGAPAAAASKVRPPCIPGDTVNRNCPQSPLYNRRGVDNQPGYQPANPFQSPFGTGGSAEEQRLRRRQMQQRN